MLYLVQRVGGPAIWAFADMAIGVASSRDSVDGLQGYSHSRSHCMTLWIDGSAVPGSYFGATKQRGKVRLDEKVGGMGRRGIDLYY